MVHSLASLLAKKVVGNAGVPADKLPYIAYGLEIILGCIIKTICFLIVPWFFGVLPQTLAAVASSVLLRYFSGGTHCTSLFRCLLSTLTIFTMAGIVTKYILGSAGLSIDFFGITLFLASLVVIIKYAPADTPNRPITTQREKLRLKTGSIFLVILYGIILLAVPFNQDIKIAMLLGLAIQTFTITPLGYSSIRTLDSSLSKLV